VAIDDVPTPWGVIDIREFKPVEPEPVVERETMRESVGEHELDTVAAPPEGERMDTRDLRQRCNCVHTRASHDMAMSSCNECMGSFQRCPMFVLIEDAQIVRKEVKREVALLSGRDPKLLN
jgi:hypothetical protein